ncbi:MAG: protein kinase [Nannocystaceae bacterium]|nr:protein kinase [Deltaproteobacteria bacterium]MBP7285612.1 protein kinase [Nannocystaceae bacterium]
MSMICPDADEIVAYAQGHAGAAMRQRIAAHVDGCEVCVGLVAEAARLEATGMSGRATAGDAAVARGSTLGRHLVLELVGEGGLGRVYAAYDPELDRRIAIKLITHGAAAGDELRSRLVREAQALAKLRHPNVVAVYDVGVVGSQVFIAMELVEGSTLREWLLAEPRSWSQVRDIFLAAARGLAAVHDAGLVHRDVKPSNILIGHDERVQIADFGLARAFGSHDDGAGDRGAPPLHASTLEASLTRSGIAIGTPAYMSPEQHRGARVDARADQFGFGVALFEALHGVRPFAGDTSEQLHAAAASGTITATVVGRTPAWLRRVALRAIAADPAQRFESMHAIIDALQHDRRARRWRAVAASVALVVGGAAVWGLVLAPALAPPPDQLAAVDAIVHEARAAAAQTHFVYPAVEAPAQPTAYTKVLELEAQQGAVGAIADERAAVLRDEFADTLVRLGDRFWEIDGGRPFAAEYYAAALVFADDHPRALARAGVSIAAVVALRERAAGPSFEAPELRAVAPVLALADDDAEARDQRIELAYAGDPEPPAAITSALERVLGDPGRAAVARGRGRRTQLADASVPPVRPTLAQVDAEAHRAPPSDASSIAAPVRPAAPEPVRPSPRSAGGDHVRVGRDALRRGDLEQAAAAFHRALAVDRDDVRALTGLAEVSFQRRAYESAAELLERASAVAPRDAAIHLDLGDVYFKVLRYDDARAQYERARELGHADAARRLVRLDQRLGADR